MIRILTDKGVSLDIDPSAEFEIEYENPMLDDSHMPVPYSTAVALLPSATNCKALGYFPSMMLEPITKNIPVTIEVGGIPLFSGALTYDSIEDGKLNYTFSGRDMEAEWSKKIWQLDIFSYKGANVGNVINDVVNGNISGVSAPLMVNPSSVADSVYKDDNGKTNRVDVNAKYLNCPLIIADEGISAYGIFAYSGFTPVIDIDRILAAFPDVWSARPSFSPLAIVGRYPSSVLHYKIRQIDGGASAAEQARPSYSEGNYNLAETLPDITMAELVNNLAKIHCAAVYYDGDKLKYVRFNDVLAASAEDWSGKISDEYSLDKEDICQYTFGFADDDSSGYGSSSLTEATIADEVPMVAGLSKVLAAAAAGDYTAVQEAFTGDVFSGKFIYFRGNKVYLEDMVFHNTKSRESEVPGSDASSFDAKSDFTPVRTIPEVLYKGTPSSSYSPIYRVAPLVAQIPSDSDRDTKVYVGYVYGGQMSDSGYTLGPDGKDLFCGGPLTKLDYPSLMSVDDLWMKYHENFATWLSSERQCVTADLNLSLFDICNFRMYRLVYFNARRWVVRKLTLTFNVNSDSVSARGEFLSYDSQR
jgi:hypothetical protein